MEALSLTVPWALLIPLGKKRWETWSWKTSYRGPLLIHAARGLAGMSAQELHTLCNRSPFVETFADTPWRVRHHVGTDAFPCGMIVGITDLVAIVPTDAVVRQIDAAQRAFGNYALGRWAWRLDNARFVRKFLPARGTGGVGV